VASTRDILSPNEVSPFCDHTPDINFADSIGVIIIGKDAYFHTHGRINLNHKKNCDDVFLVSN
jgi:hypothetical protein